MGIKVSTIIFCLYSLINSTLSFASERLVVISPHKKSTKDEYVGRFEEYYKNKYKTNIHVDWIDQGGTSNDLRFVQTKFSSNPNTCDIDVFWGGGLPTHIKLKSEGLIQPYKLPNELSKQIPVSISNGNVLLRDKDNFWFGSALSAFGILYNKRFLKIENLPEPSTWADLADPKFFGRVTLADPRWSGAASAMYVIILESLGWEKGWRLLTEISANTARFNASSTEAMKDIVSGTAVVTASIDYYAYGKISELGSDVLGFVLPKAQTMMNADPVAILKGAPNKLQAERFIEYILSVEAQKILLYNKGVPGGPSISFLGRFPVNSLAYEKQDEFSFIKINPFKSNLSMNTIDEDKYAKITRPLNDLISALLIETHGVLRKSWAKVSKMEKVPEDFYKLPVSEKELISLSDKWNDNIFRNRKINEWISFANKKYKSFK